MWTGGVIGYGIRAGAIVAYTVVASLWALMLPRKRASARLMAAAPGWARTMLRLCGVRVLTEGAEHVRQGYPFIYVCNHASLLDIPVLMTALPDRLCFLYKKSLERIPFFGWVLRRMPYVAITRRPLDALQQIEQAIQRLRHEGLSPVVFAEGGRSFDGAVRPFKRGVFLLAQKVQRPIVPVAIAGTHALLPPGSLRFRPGVVRVRIGKPLEPPGALSRAEQHAWLEQLRSTIAHWVEELSRQEKPSWKPVTLWNA